MRLAWTSLALESCPRVSLSVCLSAMSLMSAASNVCLAVLCLSVCLPLSCLPPYPTSVVVLPVLSLSPCLPELSPSVCSSCHVSVCFLSRLSAFLFLLCPFHFVALFSLHTPVNVCLNNFYCLCVCLLLPIGGHRHWTLCRRYPSSDILRFNLYRIIYICWCLFRLGLADFMFIFCPPAIPVLFLFVLPSPIFFCPLHRVSISGVFLLLSVSFLFLSLFVPVSFCPCLWVYIMCLYSYFCLTFPVPFSLFLFLSISLTVTICCTCTSLFFDLFDLSHCSRL